MGQLDCIEYTDSGQGEVVTFPSGTFGNTRERRTFRKVEMDESKGSAIDQVFQIGAPIDNSSINTKSFFEPWTIFIVSDLASGFRSHVEWLSGLVPNVELNSSPCEMFREISAFKPYSSIAVVDIDMFGDLGFAVRDLSEFRRRTPMVPITIGSRNFKRNDFSSERSVIADSSVVLPATKEVLGMAISASLNNHKTRLENLMFKTSGRCSTP